MTATKPPSDERARRVPWSVHALVVLGVVVIAFGPQVVWLISVMLRPDDVTSAPPTSEAISVSAITGLLGLVGGAALANTGKSDRHEP
ncbi:MAG: hypothetical protein ACRBK7_14500 [Acidimicrobiales bacterium]